MHFSCRVTVFFISFLVICGCSNSSYTGTDTSTHSSSATDIKNIVLSERSGNCSDYVGHFSASITDSNQNQSFTSSLSISSSTDVCTFSSNSIPNYDINSASFANAIQAVNETFNISSSPSQAASVTQITLSQDNAVFLNGVKLDLLAAACYGVGPNALGSEKIGCSNSNQPFRYDPMSPLNQFGTDSHNAHTQPDGAYHYHGDPRALYDLSSTSVQSPVIGFAADGFPIFGPLIDDNGTVRRVKSSYQLKTGLRQTQTFNGQTYDPSGTTGAFSGEEYNGRFVDDYEYSQGSGDLDECNGMTNADGVYGYYVTDSYPWVMACFKGTPDSSFNKR